MSFVSFVSVIKSC